MSCTLRTGSNSSDLHARIGRYGDYIPVMNAIPMTSGNPPPEKPPGDTPATTTTGPRRVITSQDLLHGEQEVLIDHEGEQYRLRLTRNGKLILQK